MRKIKGNYRYNSETEIVNILNQVMNSCKSFRIILGSGDEVDTLKGGIYSHTKKLFENPSDVLCKFLLSKLCDVCHEIAKCDNKTSSEELEQVKDIKGSCCFVCVSWSQEEK